MRIVVGAPVHERGWVLPHYFDALRSQDFDFEFVFNLGPGTDTTEAVLALEEGRWKRFEVMVDEGDDHVARRTWHIKRYETMSRLRNRLLERVRELEPDYYLSLDTDILLPPGAIRTLVEELGSIGTDGISPLMYMTESGDRYPNTMYLDRPERIIPRSSQTIVVPVAFAAKLMTPSLYSNVDYAPHRYGEDLGWGNAVAEAGYTLALAPKVRAKHVMKPAMLSQIDVRVGF